VLPDRLPVLIIAWNRNRRSSCGDESRSSLRAGNTQLATDLLREEGFYLPVTRDGSQAPVLGVEEDRMLGSFSVKCTALLREMIDEVTPFQRPIPAPGSSSSEPSRPFPQLSAPVDCQV
jgi:hypothetical protein